MLLLLADQKEWQVYLFKKNRNYLAVMDWD